MARIPPVKVDVVVDGTTKLDLRPRVKVILDHPGAKLPVYAKDGDAGADITAVANPNPNRSGFTAGHNEKMDVVSVHPGDWVIPPGQTVMLDTGLRIELPDGWEMQVRSRSGLAKRGLVVANSPGTIDSGYRGPCSVLLHNNSRFVRVIKPGTRVAQFVVKPAPQAVFQIADELSDSERGEGGFGSTGTK